MSHDSTSPRPGPSVDPRAIALTARPDAAPTPAPRKATRKAPKARRARAAPDTHRGEPHHVPRFGGRVQRAYILGLGLIALLSVGSFAVVDGMVAAQAHSAAVINVAGRQRMLSQRVARLGHSVVALAGREHPSERQQERLREETALLRRAVAQMETAHEGLMRGDPARDLPGIGSPEERRLYESGPHAVDERVRSHVADARRVLDRPGASTSPLAVRRMTEAADRPLLDALHAVVQLHEGKARAHTETMRRAHLVILLVTLAALVVEALVIFRPLVAKLAATERSLAGRKAELWHQSRHDQLTGLPNRRALREAVERARGETAPDTETPDTAAAAPDRRRSTDQRSTDRRVTDCPAADRLGPAQRRLAAERRRSGSMRREGLARPAGPFAGAYALLAIDLDNFKRLNDTVGHEAGDDLLRAVGAAIAKEVRDGDLAVRMGGDEFVVVVPLPGGNAVPGAEATVDVPAIVAARLQGALRRAIAADTRAACVSASIGVADAAPGTPFDEAMASADIALYEAKSAGRDRWVRFHPAMRAAHAERDATDALLREGMARDAFEPHFQPQVNLRTGETVGVEALARLIDTDGRPVPPADFLPAAERSGLIVPLGRGVIERAVEAAAGWERAGAAFGRLSVNASAAQLRDPNFAPFLARVLSQHGLPPARLAVEVLETVILDRDGAQIVATCHAIREQGIAIELDDFGTGYASIANVEALGVERIKIDRSILAGAPTAERDVLRAIVTMAGGLSVDVMAEGVESAEDGARLLALGCVEAQGYHLARPMPSEAMGVWLLGRADPRDVQAA